jgi:hypothetical protein
MLLIQIVSIICLRPHTKSISIRATATQAEQEFGHHRPSELRWFVVADAVLQWGLKIPAGDADGPMAAV